LKNEDILALLNFDIESEHAAIIQYLSHAYAIGEGEIACEIEAVAREEMRHFDWLAEAATGMGGQLSLKRGTMRMEGKSPVEWMENDVLLEEDAIAPYTQQIKVIEDPDLNRLIRRILSDEKAHHDKFLHYVKKTRKEKTRDVRRDEENEVNQFLNWGIEHEYTVALQYLLHSYHAKDEEIREELQDQATNEMQHLGWLAEGLVDAGGNPRIEFSKINKARGMANMLKADIEIEKSVAAEYDRGVREVVKDEELKKLITRIRDHEIYHAELFNELLKKEKNSRDK
jgi:bacterioferritin